MSGKVLLTIGEMEHYLADLSCDNFVTALKLSGFHAKELLAYYNGESVTPYVVEYARDSVASGPAPLPIKSVGRTLIFNCTDGPWHGSLDIGTLCRYFELISDLYELDTTLTQIDLPFSVEVVRKTIQGLSCQAVVHLDLAVPVLQFLRLKESIYYLRYHCSTSTNVALLRRIASDIPEEVKSKRAYWARLVDEPDVWPLMYSLVRQDEDPLPEEYVLFKLLQGRPSVLFAVLCLSGYIYTQSVLDLLCSSKFEDRFATDMTDVALVSVTERIVNLAEDCSSAKQMRHVMAVLGIRGQEYENETLEVIQPFYKSLTVTDAQREAVVASYNKLTLGLPCVCCAP